MRHLLNKLNTTKAVIGIIGLGYVGLPLAKTFVSKNFKVIGFDNDPSKLKLLKHGKSYINHIDSKNIKYMLEKKLFNVTNQYNNIKKCDVIILCVPTPLTKNLQPDLYPIKNTAKNIYKFLKKDQLVVLESSTYPGTTDEILSPILELSGLNVNKDFYLAYSPEREDPGNKDFQTSNITKLVGANTSQARQLVKILYEKVISNVFVMSSTKAAEASKLTENIYRSVNIAMVNELKVIFDAMNLDIWEIIEGAATKPFGYTPFYPGPGLGGHCIPIDPFYLTYKAKEFGISTKFIELAGELHSRMPFYVIEKISEALNTYSKKPFQKSKILILGIAYKKDIDDMRESPSLSIIEELEKKGAKVDFHDTYIPSIPSTRDHKYLAGRKSKSLSIKNIKLYDIIVICTDHSTIDYQALKKNAKVIVDTRNAIKRLKGKAIVIKA